MGQALLPEHFYAQEQALREEVHLRLFLQAAPTWGLGSLQWDDFQLQKGIVSIQELSLVLPSGALIDIPGNTAPAVFNLSATGATVTPLYLHLQSGYDVVAIDHGDTAEEGIERIVQKIEISASATSDTAAQSFKLAHFACAPDATWSLEPDYIPPLLRIGSSPFFAEQRRRMDAVFRALKQVLMEEVQQNHLAGESQSTAKACLRGLFAFQEVLIDLDHGIGLHPYDVFRALRSLHADVCVLRGIDPSVIERVYDHDDLGKSFAVLLDKLEEQAQIGRATVPYVGFSRIEGTLSCELGKDVRRAKDVYLLIQKPHVGTKLDLSGVKLASPARIHTVYERALRGIPFERLDSLPFHHGLSSTVEFYALTPGQEWDHAIREGKVVLFDGPQVSKCRLYLYWRTE